ncbi:MAG TPA: CDP-alcohol phosphatidyltransferase family protein [Candidatus Acidoferrales bacterium]|nr:CDP-alcohol phosphatidyltransferase family protein [Candidatus Acidoferrales bacterium]
MANRVFSVPNQITFLRMGFLPFLIIAIRYSRYDWALALLVIAALSDGLDGLLARRLNQKTQLGTFLDPIADKLLLSSCYLMLAFKGKIAWWLAILVLGRDALILIACAVILLVIGYMTFPPSLYGKLNTAFQILLVLVVLLAALFPNPALRMARVMLVYLVAAFTILSGFHYSITVARRL